jgi:anhydro-N-acetylmuramic acid kinase
MKKKLVLGIMSGTSLGDVDYALCEIGGPKIQLRRLWSVEFPPALHGRLHAAARGDLKSWELGQLHHDLGRFYARHATRGLPKERPDFVGLHGQTVFHNPNKKNPATLQLGEPAYLVEVLRVPVVSNFRSGDIAAGGQGAPLATIFHQFVFAKPGVHVCVNNLGGISNVTSLDWRKGRGTEPEVLAFDTGPANMLSDLAIRQLSEGKKHFDKNGGWAAKGQANEALLSEWLAHPYFRQRPPKSTGRELFGEPFLKSAMKQMRRLSTFDVLATFTEFTARSLALNYRLHLGSLPQKVILTGGGAANPFLVKAIQKQFSNPREPVEVLTSVALDWPVQAIEAAAFALLAYLRMTGQSGNLPQTTGARRKVLLGQISE